MEDEIWRVAWGGDSARAGNLIDLEELQAWIQNLHSTNDVPLTQRQEYTIATWAELPLLGVASTRIRVVFNNADRGADLEGSFSPLIPDRVTLGETKHATDADECLLLVRWVDQAQGQASARRHGPDAGPTAPCDDRGCGRLLETQERICDGAIGPGSRRRPKRLLGRLNLAGGLA